MFRRFQIFAATLLMDVGFTATVGRARKGPESLVLSLMNLAPLNEGEEVHYEGWAIIDGSPVSTGKFNVNEGGRPIGLDGGSVIEEFDAGQTAARHR